LKDKYHKEKGLIFFPKYVSCWYEKKEKIITKIIRRFYEKGI